MSNLKTILKRWSYERQVLSSPPIKEKKAFQNVKQMLTRAWIQADYVEAQGIIRIPLNPATTQGKANVDKLEKLQITF